MSFIICFLLAIGPAFAQTYVLETIDVTAEKDVSDFDFSAPVKIPSHQLETQATGLALPALMDVPGLIITQSGGPGSNASFFLRGTESRHVSFTLDGLKLNDASNVDRQFDSAFMTSAFVQEVEVHKGPQAVLYGSDALGGVVELTSRKGEKAPETRLNINVGSFGTVDSSLSQDWKKESHQGTLTLTRFHTDGLSRLNEKRFHAKERDAADITQLTSSSRHRWNERWQTDFMASLLRGENELDGATEDTTEFESKNDQYLLQQKTGYKLSEASGITLRNGLNRHQRSATTSILGQQAYEGDVIENELLYTYKKSDFSLLTGIASTHEELERVDIERSFDLHSTFLQTSWKLSNWMMHVGSRAERHVRYGSFYTGSGGIAYNLGVSVFSLQYSQGYKTPSLFQLYFPDIGNPNLVPEVNHSWEGAWRLIKESVETEVVLFQNRLSNLFTFTTAQGYINQARFITEGIEFNGKYKRNNFELRSGFLHQDFRKEENPVLRRPLNSLSMGAAFFPTENTEATLRMRWFDSRKDFDPNQNVVKLNAFETWDLGYRVVLQDSDFGVQLMNILNREYEEQFGFSVMPLSVMFHAGFRL